MFSDATLTIISGPDRGRTFAVDGEMVNIGLGGENEVRLTDNALSELHASIAVHNDQFVIYSPVNESVTVEGTVIPAERWVKLPVPARIQLGDRTVGHFRADESPSEEQSEDKYSFDDEDALPDDVSSAAAVATPPPPPPPPPPAEKKDAPKSQDRSGGGKKKRNRSADGRRSDKGKRAKKSNRKTARFITDTGGDAKVALGDDGTLPELVLAESATKKKVQQQQKKEGNPIALYIAVSVSFLMSIALLFIDAEPAGQSVSELNEARQAVKEYYREDGELKRYQKLLRQAALAHARRDRAGEVRAYRQVLNLLNSEDNERSFLGLTGDREDDELLRKYVSILVGK